MDFFWGRDFRRRRQPRDVYTNFRSIRFCCQNFLNFSTEWFALRKFNSYRFFRETFPGNFRSIRSRFEICGIFGLMESAMFTLLVSSRANPTGLESMGTDQFSHKIRKFWLKIKWNNNCPENPFGYCGLPPEVLLFSRSNQIKSLLTLF